MPLYEYECPECSSYKELQRSIVDRDLPLECEGCDKGMERITVPSSFGIAFKGSGFYKTDNPK